MHLSAITVCIDFADFLADTLPVNRPHFNQYVIVTSSDDAATQRFARKHACKLVVSDRFRETHAFDKGAAINDGLAVADKRQWLCHLDADIVLPANFRQWLIGVRRVVKHADHLNEHIIGMHRHNCRNRAEWLKWLATHQRMRLKWPVEKLREWNQIPAGYLQIWHASMGARYPEGHPTASGSDIAFGEQFTYRFHPNQPRVIHLEAKSRQNEDYRGRKSPPWRELPP